jgi:hypothetical protein
MVDLTQILLKLMQKVYFSNDNSLETDQRYRCKIFPLVITVSDSSLSENVTAKCTPDPRTNVKSI